MSEWDGGRYEVTAAALLPAAARAVEIAGVRSGDRVLDVACGTGNASAEAIARGAQVTGVDTAERLLGVARERTPGAQFLAADATSLPFADDSFDVALSVFGVIFAPMQEAVAELVRVVRPGGRVVVTTWVQAGPLFAASRLMRAAVAEHREEQETTAWHEPDTLRELFAPRDVVVHDERLVLRAATAAAIADDYFDAQPMWVAARAVVGDARYEQLRAETTELLAEANEDTAAWQGTLPYLAAEVRV